MALTWEQKNLPVLKKYKIALAGFYAALQKIKLLGYFGAK